MKTGLYIHIPFCKQKCNYCDFASFAGRDFLIDEYLSTLEKEASLSPVSRFETLYVGGGTPSILSVEQLQKLCKFLSEHFGSISDFKESTF